MDIQILRAVVHYTLHFVAPLLLALLFFPDGKRRKAYFIMLATMVVDLDHLFATPIFAPVLCCLPYGRRRYLPWWGRAVAIGLLFHMITDWQDYMLWPH